MKGSFEILVKQFGAKYQKWFAVEGEPRNFSFSWNYIDGEPTKKRIDQREYMVDVNTRNYFNWMIWARNIRDTRRMGKKKIMRFEYQQTINYEIFGEHTSREAEREMTTLLIYSSSFIRSVGISFFTF